MFEIPGIPGMLVMHGMSGMLGMPGNARNGGLACGVWNSGNGSSTRRYRNSWHG